MVLDPRSSTVKAYSSVRFDETTLGGDVLKELQRNTPRDALVDETEVVFTLVNPLESKDADGRGAIDAPLNNEVGTQGATQHPRDVPIPTIE